MLTTDYIKSIATKYLDTSEVSLFNSIYQDSESSVFREFSRYLSPELSQLNVDYIFSNSNMLDPDFGFLIKNHISKYIISLWVENKNIKLFEDNFFLIKEIKNNFHYVLMSYDNFDLSIKSIRRICSIFPDFFIFEHEIFNFYSKAANERVFYTKDALKPLDVNTLNAIFELALKYSKLALICQIDNYIQYDERWYNLIINSLSDDSYICRYITNVPADNIMHMHLYTIIANRCAQLPKTIENLIDVAIDAKCTPLIMNLSRHFSKKRTFLNKLYQSDDQDIIKRFIQENKSNEELKDLIVYY